MVSTNRVAYLTGPEAVELRVDPLPPPGAGELLLRIEAATTCGTDLKVWRRGGHPRMLRVPTPFGHEMAGTVVEVGPGVDRWGAGDRVVVSNSAPCSDCEYCRLGRENLCEDLHYLNGGFAEHILVPARFVERAVHRLPADLPFELAALTEPLACVLHGVGACELGEPTDVVLYGAGPIGLLFVGVLAAEGHRVVVADPNPPRLAVASAFGAVDTVEIERGGGQSARLKARSPGGKGFPVVVEATGVPAVWEDALATVRVGGLVNLFGGCAPGTRVEVDTHRLHYGEVTVKGVYHHRPETVRAALAWLAARRFDAGRLLSAEEPLAGLDRALRAMADKRALKVLIRPHAS